MYYSKEYSQLKNQLEMDKVLINLNNSFEYNFINNNKITQSTNNNNNNSFFYKNDQQNNNFELLNNFNFNQYNNNVEKNLVNNF